MTYIESTVTFKDIAAVLKRTVPELEVEAVEFGLFLGSDWAGRPATAERTLTGSVSGSARRVREDEAALTALDLPEPPRFFDFTVPSN